MDKKSDNIYIYLWEEFNTIYVGRTINPKSRHYTHRHREAERTYQFSSEHHVEHPKMIIIESDLTIEEGVEREKYWINYYKNNTNYNVLNKSEGGQRGRQRNKLSDEEREKRRKISLNKSMKKYKEENKEKLIEYRKVYYQQNKEKFYENRKDKVKEYQGKYYRENQDKIKKYREEHNEKIREYRKKYYINNKEKFKKVK